jgi:hypothetical protein
VKNPPQSPGNNGCGLPDGMLKLLIGSVKTGSKITLIAFLALKNITIYATIM